MSTSNASRQSSREKEKTIDTRKGATRAGSQPSPGAILQRAQIDPNSLTSADTLHLQRTIGNQATGRLLAQHLSVQAKLEVGPVNDQFEQEANNEAHPVVRRLAEPPVQRDDDLEEEVQAKPLSYPGRSYTTEQPAQLKRTFVARETPKVRRDEVEDELAQAAPIHGRDGGEVEPSVAQSIQRAKGGGDGLDPKTRTEMEGAFGASFGGVRIHTGSASDILNRSLNARAFTSGSDIFFRHGEYNPGSSGGKTLLAHELTHTVQQGASGPLGTSGPVAQRSLGKQQQARLSHSISSSISSVASRHDVIQPARQTFGRILGSILSLGSGDPAARMTFGFRKDRKKITTATDDLSDLAPYAATDVEIMSDSYVLRGRRYSPKEGFAEGPGADKAVILLSGSGGSNEDQMEPVADYYCKKGTTAFGVNYRGFGASMDRTKKNIFSNKKVETTPYLTENGLYKDARRIYDYVAGQGFTPGNIVLHGFSLGGAVAANLAKSLAKQGIQLGGVVMHSSIRSAYKAASGMIGMGPIGGLAGAITKGAAGSFDTKRYLELLQQRDANIPIHFMSGSNRGGDHLSLEDTDLQNSVAGFANQTSHQGTGGHLSHDDAVPSSHLDRGFTEYLESGESQQVQGNQDYLAELLGRGRG